MKTLKRNLKRNEKLIFQIIKAIIILALIIANLFKVNYVIDTDFVNTVFTLVSILFGFLISAECNLFGRLITQEMKKRNSIKEPGQSQFGELKNRFSRINSGIMSLIVISLSYYFAKALNLGNDIVWHKIAESVSVVYVVILLNVLWSTYKESEILLIHLGNEAELSNRKKDES